MMKWYTGSGDFGETSIPRKGKVGKDSIYVEALGDLDELVAILGIIRSLINEEDIKEILFEVQKTVFSIGSMIAGYSSKFEGKTEKLERLIEHYDKKVTPIRNFVIPGNSLESSFVHLARAVARRAERRVVNLLKKEERDLPISVISYLNRLSSLLFVIALYLNSIKGIKEDLWISQKE